MMVLQALGFSFNNWLDKLGTHYGFIAPDLDFKSTFEDMIYRLVGFWLYSTSHSTAELI